VSRRGWVLFGALAVIWGLPYLLIKVAVEDFSPVTVVFLRCAIGAVLLLPWTLTRGRPGPALRRHWRALLLFTVLEMTGPWLLLSWAETELSSSLTGLLVAGVPLVAALAARLAGEEERLSRVRLVGMGVGVVGIAVLLGLDVGGAHLGPVLAVALVVVGYATAPLVISRRLSDVPGVTAAAIALVVTAVVYAPFAVPRLGAATHAPADAWTAVVVLGVVCTAAALALFFALIREAGPQRALVITFVNPAVAVALGVLLLDEPFTLGLAVGLPLILIGCVLATRRSPAPAGAALDRAGHGGAAEVPAARS
jgi:drug/metabolite transporter (DMT)-like permease